MKELIEEQREELIEKTLELMRDALINIRDFEKSTNLMFNFYMNKNKHVQR